MTIYTALAEGEFSLKESITLSCRLAKKLDTKLIGVSAMPDPARAVIMTGVSMHGVMFASGGSLLEGIREAQKEAREKLEAAFTEVCEAEGVTNREIEHTVGLPTEVYPRLSLLSDGLVTPHECVSAGNEHGLAFETTLLDRREPIIVAGQDSSPNISTMIVAWDGSPQAARSVRFHTQLLRAADRVIVAQNSNKIDTEDRFGGDQPAYAVDYLQQRGIPSEIIQFDGAVTEGLLKLAEDEGAGLIVAGAYGHSRLEEMIFGGVSKNLLRTEKGPALALAH
ncbi:MAG: universal stress protein UspA [Ponticaulis sp.]|nr:universal stress protein UspA [Ponticaulis sp.]|tara:strand:+ start:16651 stop:17493 length:843 start_codon:yes stop_codon:yes gene_type:complete